ncbi:ADOP family duplicated permease [Gaopeijia maritima]|uniref:ADOP family duplicated permease n=1 Tax=Gaopeijia maritima TaxID=3119007 RepID=UPI003249B578
MTPVRGWERWMIRCALRAWPRATRLDDAEDIEATFTARRAAGPTRWPAAIDTVAEACNLVATGLRLRRSRRSRSRSSGYGSVVPYAVRRLIRSPRWSAMVGGVFALGLGAAATVFTIVDGVSLRPLPYGDPEALVRIGAAREGRPGPGSLSGPNFRDIVEQTSGLAMATASSPASIGVGIDGRPNQLVRGGWVSGAFFATLGRAPLEGRILAESDDRPGAPRVVVVSHAFAAAQFGDDSPIGRSISIEGSPATIVGVMGPDFFPPEATNLGGTQLWVPLAHAPLPTGERGLAFLDVVGRLAPNVGVERLEAELTAVAEGLITAHSLSPRAFNGLTVRPLRAETLGGARPTLAMLMGAVSLLLAITCLNIGNLVVLRTIDGAASLRVRLSLGASRARVVAEVATETVVLAFVGGVAGLWAARMVTRAIVHAAPIDLPRLAEVALDARVAAVALAVSVLIGLLVGLLPALRLVAHPGGLQRSARAATGSVRFAHLRDALVLIQVSMGLALAIGAGLLTRSLVRMHAVEQGFDARGLAVATLRLDGIGGPDFDPSLLTRLRDGAAGIAGVTHASLTSGSPYMPGGMRGYAEPEGASLPPDQLDPSAIEFHRSSPGHLEGVGLRLREGRFLSDADRSEAPAVAVISESVAAALWPDRSALGERLILGGDGTFTPREVVGVVANPRYRGPALEPEQHIWVPWSQVPLAPLDLVIRTADGATPAAELSALLDSFGGAATLRSLRSVPEAAAHRFTEPAFFTSVLGAFALLASALSAVGLYGTLSHAVRTRRREFGVRLALGAHGSLLTRAVVRHGAGVTLLGVLGGLLLALMGVGFVDSRLFGISGMDPVTWVGASAVLLGAGLLASWLPARFAGRVSPLACLRIDSV